MHGAVIGAGIAGIAMTHALRRVGIHVDLFERAPEPRSTGYQLNVLTNGMYALSEIGLLAPLRQSGHGAPMRAAPVFDGASGKQVRSLTLPGADTEFAPSSLYRGDLHRLLLGALDGAPPHCGCTVETVVDDPKSSRVDVRFSDGETRGFDFVIGADGAYSRLRKQLFAEHPGYTHRFRALLFAVHVDLDGEREAERRFAEQLRRGEFVQFVGADRVVVLSAAGGTRFSVIVTRFDDEFARGVSNPDEARICARGAVKGFRDPRIHYAIERATWEEGNPIVWNVGDIDPVPAFHVGRVALTGDAAHAMIPVVGQGANQSFEDAMLMSRELGSIASGEPYLPARISEAFQRYSAERQPHVARVQAEARARVDAMSAGRPVAASPPGGPVPAYEDHILKYAIADPRCPLEPSGT